MFEDSVTGLKPCSQHCQKQTHAYCVCHTQWCDGDDEHLSSQDMMSSMSRSRGGMFAVRQPHYPQLSFYRTVDGLFHRSIVLFYIVIGQMLWWWNKLNNNHNSAGCCYLFQSTCEKISNWHYLDLIPMSRLLFVIFIFKIVKFNKQTWRCLRLTIFT